MTPIGRKIEKITANNSYTRLKQAWHWSISHPLVIGFMILLGTVIVIMSMNRAKQFAYTSYLSLFVRPASTKLIDDVRNTTEVIDSSFLSPDGDIYQLHVLVDENIGFIPIGIQIIDPDTRMSITTESLTYEPDLHCWQNQNYEHVGKPSYQTGKLSGLPVNRLVYSKPSWRRKLKTPISPFSITLIVKTKDGLFSIPGLEIEESCLSYII